MSTTREWRLGEVCEHGSLGRQCLVCELTEDRDDLRAKLAEVERDAARWRAIEPHIRYRYYPAFDLPTLEFFWQGSTGQTKDQIVDRLVAEKEASDG